MRGSIESGLGLVVERKSLERAPHPPAKREFRHEESRERARICIGSRMEHGQMVDRERAAARGGGVGAAELGTCGGTALDTRSVVRTVHPSV